MSAIKHNSVCKPLYEKLRAEGKNGKVALKAVGNKLLKQAFAVATKATPYKADYFALPYLKIFWFLTQFMYAVRCPEI